MSQITITPVDEDEGTSLCTGCGLCCNGAIFHRVAILPVDSAPRLSALGLKLKRKRKHDYLLQPCPALADSRCTIYTERPERCRLFACRQLRAMLAGAITPAAARRKVSEALAQQTRLHALLQQLGERHARGPLTLRCDKILSQPPDPTASGETLSLRGELAAALAAFETLLDHSFRLQ